MLFFALALSWVKELAENVIPTPAQLYLRFNRNKDQGGKWNYDVLIRGIPGKGEQRVPLSRALFDLLFKFAKKKLEGEEGLVGN